MIFADIMQFFTQVKQEVTRVTWPTRKEVTMATFMVLVVVVVMSLFLLLIDTLAYHGVQLGLRIGQ